jgi:hypothetical protein
MFKKLFQRPVTGGVSWTKLGGVLVAAALAISSLPASGIAVPAVILIIAKIVGAIGIAVGVSGARDAIDK